MTIYDRLAAWSEQARTEAAPTSLPPEAYTDHNLAELERERVMRRGWINVAHISQLAAPGDYVTFEIVDHPVLAVHGVDGVLRAFSNVCPHRSAIIADGCGNRTVFRCPYHAWT
ncbi:MAG: Rieske 2Fe-2S domain-containing protein, partial [Alphaproteobacteria bacterium]|nr:Rieske 2Fe-2S domain-containing protein [Alphaproteobacteria bacterium]